MNAGKIVWDALVGTVVPAGVDGDYMRSPQVRARPRCSEQSMKRCKRAPMDDELARPKMDVGCRARSLG